MTKDNLTNSEKYTIVWRKRYKQYKNNTEPHVHIEYYTCRYEAEARGDYIRNVIGVEPTLYPPTTK